MTGEKVRGVEPEKRTVPGLRSEMRDYTVVGALGYLGNLAIFNATRWTGLGVIWASLLSSSVIMLLTYLGHRHITFRRRRARWRIGEAAAFLLVSCLGLVIENVCVFVSHYVLGFTSPLADNIAKNIVGVALGTCFRFVAYRQIVFRRRARKLPA
ncbi:GtrA family protein [Streptomyces sp. NPDC054796]